MLVDDEPFIIEGLKLIIDWDEYEIQIVHTACDGLVAVEAYLKQRVDIIITDIKMPNLNGLELIRQIKKIDTGTKYIILSGYEDFTYVKEGINLGIENYLLKPINEDELSATLLCTIEKFEKESNNKVMRNEDINILKGNVLNRWVTGKISSNELKERAELLSLKLFESNYVFVAIRVIDYDKHNSSPIELNTAIGDTYISIEEVCRKHLPEDVKNMIFHDYDGDVILPFMGNSADFTIKSVYDTMNTILSYIKKPIVIISLGNLVNHPADIPMGYENAKKMLFFSVVLEKSIIIDYTAFISKYINTRTSYKIELSSLKNFILSGEKDQAFTFINDLYNQIQKQPMITLAYLRDITIEILYGILYITKADYIKNKYIKHDLDGFFNKIYYMDRMEKLIDFVDHVISEIIDYLSEEGSLIHPLIQRVIRHTQENYAKDITLKTISHLLNMNTAYLGQLFKNETGEIFSNYLNRVRVEKAIQLLKTTNISANKVAIEVGFSNPTYFYSVFKKITGMSTIEFKQSIFR